MSQAHVETFFEIAVKVQQEPGEMIKGSIDGLEFSGEELITVAVAKGKEMGYEFTHEEAAAWIERQRDNRTGGELSNSELDSIADAFSQRDKWLDSGH